MSQCVKLILTKSGDTPQVRYVEVNRMGSPQVLHLRNSIIAAFNIAPETEFKVTWVDADGDHVEVLTEDDLRIAFLKMENPVFHISTEPKPSVSFEKPTENLEPRVLCDVCEKQVTGFRYKCLECPDYDLCSTCESAGNHPDHIFLRLPNSEFPLSRADRKIIFAAARELKRTAYRACRGAHRASRDFWKHASLSHSKESKGEKSSKSDAAFDANCPLGGCPYAGDYSFDDMSKVSSLLREHVQPILGAAATEPNIITDVIRNVMGAVFGGSAQTENAAQGNNQPTASTSQATAPNTATTTTTASSGTTAQNPAPSEKAKPTAQPENTEMDWTLINSSQVPPATSVASTISSASSVASEAASTPKPQTPSVPAPEPGFILHPDPVIARGLSQLYEMGFSNENDILTNLLRRYNGNVSEVVKTIVNMK